MRNKELNFNSSEEEDSVALIFKQAMECLKEEDRELPFIDSLLPLLKRGIGVHHSGLLPILKEVIELLFQEQLIKVSSGHIMPDTVLKCCARYVEAQPRFRENVHHSMLLSITKEVMQVLFQEQLIKDCNTSCMTASISCAKYGKSLSCHRAKDKHSSSTGLLPILKEVIEPLFQEQLIQVRLGRIVYEMPSRIAEEIHTPDVYHSLTQLIT